MNFENIVLGQQVFQKPQPQSILIFSSSVLSFVFTVLLILLFFLLLFVLSSYF